MSGRDEWSDERILAEAERGTWLPPDTRVIERPEYLLTEWAEGPRRNVVHWTHAIDHTGDALVDEVLWRLRSDGRTGVRWWVTPSTRPGDMDNVLVGRGFTLAEIEFVARVDGKPVASAGFTLAG